MRCWTLGALLALLLAGCDMLGPGEPIAFSDVPEAERLRVQISGTTVLRGSWEWERFWQSHVNGYGPDGQPPRPPEIDFSRHMVVGVFWGGSIHGGCHNYARAIRRVEAVGDGLVVYVGPLPDLGQCRMIVHPIQVIVVPRVGGEVRFVGHLPR